MAAEIKPWLNRLEQAFTAVALMLYSGGPFTVLLTGGHSQGDLRTETPDFPIMRQLFLLTYVVFFILLVLRWKKALASAVNDVFISALIALPLLSTVWSDNPSLTTTRSIAFIGTGCFGLYLATRFTLKQQLRLLGFAFVLITGLSFVYALLLPQYGIMGGVHEGTWRGIYTHKNTLGQTMVPGSTVFILLALGDRKHRPWWLLGVAGAVSLLLLSASKGALVSFLVMLFGMMVCYLARLRVSLMLTAFSFLLATSFGALAWMIFNSDRIFDALGKDATLTGRTDIWILSLEKIFERPWLGYGYQAFWDGWGSEGADIWWAIIWPTPYAHNGFLDILLQLGVAGLALFVLSFSWVTIKSLIRMGANVSAETVWPVLFLLYNLLSNLTESVFLSRNSLVSVLYIALSITVANARLDLSGKTRQAYAAANLSLIK